jgi:hypothetical protein
MSSERLFDVRLGRQLRSLMRPKLSMHRKLKLQAGQVERIQISGSEVWSMIVSVILGGADIYLGEVSQLAFPDARVVAPQIEELAFPILGQTISIMPTPGLIDPLQCTIWMMADRRETE